MPAGSPRRDDDGCSIVEGSAGCGGYPLAQRVRGIEQLNILVHLVAENQFTGALDRIAPSISVAG